jgi:FtsP/CotA-like multicopper oxidase with cupredoxin domain
MAIAEVKPPSSRTENAPSRREFIGRSIAAAVSSFLLPNFLLKKAAAQAACVPTSGEELKAIGAIFRGDDGVLRATMKLQEELRQTVYYANNIFQCEQHWLRTYHGYRGFSLDEKDQVTNPKIASPGPTFRCQLGDTVDIIFLNRIDLLKFPETGFTSSGGPCDVSRQSGKPRYPGADQGHFPNCFHASNTTNMHYHGTHTSPGEFGDNVLVGILANRVGITEAEMMARCAEAYEFLGNHPECENFNFQDLQAFKDWRKKVAGDLQAMATHDPARKAQVDLAIQVNTKDEKNHEWPQYWPGYYPYHFQLPRYTGAKDAHGEMVCPRMGQSPGTHWYHAHQHGSTTLQLLNGMAGAFVISDTSAGAYDGQILRLGGGTPEKPVIKEQLMVLQLFSEQPNLVRASRTSLTVNGQLQPKVTAAKGEVQWWRLVNAAVRAHGIDTFLFLSEDVYKKNKTSSDFLNGGVPKVADRGANLPAFRQVARDGVQFCAENYVAHQQDTQFHLSPGNRIDFLIQAPPAGGRFALVFWPAAGAAPMVDLQSNVLLWLDSSGNPSGVNTSWLPDTEPAGYPKFPPFLSDIPDDEIRTSRKLTFSMSGMTAAPGGPPTQPIVMIDGKQFSEGILDRAMLMGDAEEWTLYNRSVFSIMHPFHIHINPFQITEVFDPNQPAGQQLFKPAKNWIWQDTIAVPAGTPKNDSEGNPIVDDHGNQVLDQVGYVKIRSRFTDFAGKFVLHCHILGHEDRGMMQLVEVVNNKTVVRHE